MAVITRFIVVRNGVELDKVFDVKKEAEAYDRMLDAAENLAGFIKKSDLDLGIDETVIDTLCVYLSQNAPEVTQILKGIKPLAATADAEDVPLPDDLRAGTEKKKSQVKDPKPIDKKK
jgi:dsDNA-binding SOS-regulon protein